MILGGSGLWMPMGGSHLLRYAHHHGTHPHRTARGLLADDERIHKEETRLGKHREGIETIEAIETIEKTSKQRTLCRKPYYP